MVRYLKHNQIDKRRWDECISASIHRRIYAFSWYLDHVCPGWNALVDDDYRSVFPLTTNRKYGITYFYQPFFAQQLGIFSYDLITQQGIEKFYNAIPSAIRFAEIQVNSGNDFPMQGWEKRMRINHELNLSAAYPVLASSYNNNTARNLKRAVDGGIQIGQSPTADDLIRIFRENFGEREGKLGDEHYEILKNLVNDLTGRGIAVAYGAESSSGKLSAGAVAAFDGNRIYFLFAASTAAARENRAMFFLVDHLIRKHAGSDLIFDFEGGNDPSLGRFYKGFGAKEILYPAMKMNRLPMVARMAHDILHKKDNG